MPSAQDRALVTTRGAIVWSTVAVAVTLAAAAWLVVERRAAARAERDLGAALFHGTLPLTGHLASHDEPLPTLATRCSNCHEAVGTAPRAVAVAPPAASSESGGTDAIDRPASGTYARRLDGDWLTRPRIRHGGPPSTYDAAALCTLLRAGTDPVSVMIPSAMPRYAATDAQCRALWAHMVSP